MRPQQSVRCFHIGVTAMSERGGNNDGIAVVPFNVPVCSAYSDVFRPPRHAMDGKARCKSPEQTNTVIDETRVPKEAEVIIRRAPDSYVNIFCR